ncbi:unnamed protein product [Clonostachys rosea]|uniref:Rhodopsin domain-containing protein n=1 Tax=Bionectria ochroleuca TaxID=29856 RepID=A0ABY6UK12_BIOOC|nr:unnamed protein product [Clonostachys rosea]
MEALFPPDKSPYHWVPMPLKAESAGFLATNSVFQALAIFFVSLRFYSRITTKSVGWDDWWVLIALFLSICTFIVCICANILGSGYLVEEVVINLSSFYLLIFILQPLFLFAIMSTKLSVCFFYLRVFVNKSMRIATFVTMALVVAWAVAHYLAAVFICSPVAGQYDLRLAAQVKCGDQMKFFQSGLSINVVLDAIVIVLPLWTIWKLKMRKSDKIGLFVAFSISIAMLVVSIIRAEYVTTTSLKGDLTATLPINLFLTVFEQQLAIITISIPMLRPLWRRYRARIGGYSISEEGGKGSGYSGRAGSKSNDIVTFGGSGAKASAGSRGRRGKNDSVLDAAVELRDVEHKASVHGRRDGESSVNSDWIADDSGSETRLGEWNKSPNAISVQTEWTVSHK